MASTNAGKIREFREMLAGFGLEYSDLSQHPQCDEVEETGRTFRANACLKASAYARMTGLMTLADDSGLEVDALDGKPGVHSARWAEMHISRGIMAEIQKNAATLGAAKSPAQQPDRARTDADNNALLLSQIADVPDARRTARFVCVLALADARGRILLTARDTVEGRILKQARGENGFGYDPLFQIDELGKTTAELSSEDKHKISHRGKALRRVRELMARSGLTGT